MIHYSLQIRLSESTVDHEKRVFWYSFVKNEFFQGEPRR
jgi:hypothetical protein